MPRHLTQVSDLADADVLKILAAATAIKSKPQKYAHKLDGKILGLMFFEPSTRTYFSFASAMMRLGGNTLGFSGSQGTSLEKGETIEDTVRMMATYSDVIVIRHRDVGTCARLQTYVNTPIINAGEGTGEHPTQTLIDLFSLREHFGRFDVQVGLYGDLKHSRTIHSLVLLGSRLGMRFHGFAPPGFQLPEEYVTAIRARGGEYKTTAAFPPSADELAHLDALYVNRLQKERLGTNHPPASYFDVPLVTLAFADLLPKGCMVLDPLPRINTTDPEFDTDPRALYFTQAANGVPVRMALLQYLLK